jgi:hypothetical protein
LASDQHRGNPEPHTRVASSQRDVVLGRYRFRAVYRQVATDEGPAIHVFGPAGGSDEEVLRFDCFQSEAHYHLGWSYRDVPFIRIESSDPLAWVLDQLTSNLDALLEDAGAEPLTDEEVTRLPKAIARLRRKTDAIRRRA